jgi:hypothetical protein
MRVGAGIVRVSGKSATDCRSSASIPVLRRTTIRLSASMPQIAMFAWGVWGYLSQF